MADRNLRADLVSVKNINKVLLGTKSRIPGCSVSSPISVVTVESKISCCIGYWNVDWIYLAEGTVQSEYDNESQVSVKSEEFLDYIRDF